MSFSKDFNKGCEIASKETTKEFKKAWENKTVPNPFAVAERVQKQVDKYHKNKKD